MSLMDEAHSIRERIRERLQELAPLVQEYRELLAVAEEMGVEVDVAPELAAVAATAQVGDTAPPTPTTPTPTPTPTPAPARPSGPRRPARGGRGSTSQSRRGNGSDLGAQVLAAVNRQPGGTVADYAERLGVTAAVLYRPVRDLTSDGRLVKRGRQLLVP